MKEHDEQYASTLHCLGTHAAGVINASRDKGEEYRLGKQGLCHNYGMLDYLVFLFDCFLFFFPSTTIIFAVILHEFKDYKYHV